MVEKELKRIIVILFLVIYIAIILNMVGCYFEDKCHYQNNTPDPISLEIKNIIGENKTSEYQYKD